jgi:glycosyltransferase involved in cell wall biosynthesis
VTDGSPPLRIALLGHKGIPAVHGGIERHVDEIARGLVRRGHRVDVFNRPYHPYRSGGYEGVRLRRRPSIPTKHLDAGTHTLWCVLETILSRRYDLVHVHGIGPGIFVGLAQPFLPTVFTFHAQDWRQRKWSARARDWLRRGEAMAVRRADAVITVSQLLRDYVRERYGRDADCIPNGAHVLADPGHDALATWGLEPGRYLLFVGRLISDRGLAGLVEAHAGLAGAPLLVIVGDVQHDRRHVDELRARAGAGVVFTGYQSGATLAQLYANALVCVHPSEVEGLPIAVLEAMGAGKCVLVSDIPENLEAIGDAGARFAVGDVRDLSAQLGALLADPDRIAALGARARARVEREFDWDAIVARTERVYRHACAARRGLESAGNGLQGARST